MTKRGGTRPSYSTRENYQEWGLHTEVDEKNRQFTITVPFAPDRLPYYPVLVAALIAGRSPGSMYRSLQRGRHGLEGVKVEGVAHVTHDSIIEYLRRRAETAEAVIARKRASVQKMVKQRPRKRPRPPKAVSATQSAKHLLDTGAMDFLKPLKDQMEAAGG